MRSKSAGQYELLSKLDHGDTGNMYKVRHRVLDQVRVIKIMRHQQGDASWRERFIHEMKTGASVHHQNLARLYDVATDRQGSTYFVSEWITGLDLNHIRMTLAPLDVGVAAQLAYQALAAIGRLHQASLVHRRLSPHNFVVTLGPDGEPQVKLIDFDIAKFLDYEDSLAETGGLAGGITYSSPEHFGGLDGEAEVEARSDLYSLAVILYELLTNVSPITGTGIRSIVASHLFHPSKDFSESDPQGRLSEAVRGVVSKGLEKEASRRFRDAKSFGNALRQAASEEIAASWKPDGPWPRLRAYLEKSRAPAELQDDLSSIQAQLETVFPLPSKGPGAQRPEAQRPTAGPNARSTVQALADARRLLERRQPDQALLKVRQILARAPNQAEALQLKAEIEEAHNRLAAKLRNLRAQKEAKDKILTLLEQEQISEAEELLAAVRSELGEAPALANLDEKIAEQWTIRAQKAAADQARQAEGMLAEQRLDDAVSLLRSARELDPLGETIVELLTRAESELAADLEKKSREQALRPRLDQIDDALNQESLEDAENHLRQLEEDFGASHREVAPRAQRIAALHTKLRADALVDFKRQLEELIEEESFREAETVLAEAISQCIETDSTLTKEWVAFEEGIHRGREALLFRATRLLEAGELQAAETIVRKAGREGVRPDQIQDLEKRLERLIKTSDPMAASPQTAAAGQNPGTLQSSAREARIATSGKTAASPSPSIATTKKTRPAWMYVGAAITLAAVIGFSGAVLFRSSTHDDPTVNSEPVARATANGTGTLRLDGLPWVEVVKVVDGQGQLLAVPERGYTPIAFELSVGTYTLTVTHPSFEQPQEVEVVLQSGEVTSKTVTVAQYSANRYFETSW